MLATALVASVADPRAFRSGRNFSAWIGLVPKQHSKVRERKIGAVTGYLNAHVYLRECNRRRTLWICIVLGIIADRLKGPERER
jgi:transposase